MSAAQLPTRRPSHEGSKAENPLPTDRLPIGNCAIERRRQPTSNAFRAARNFNRSRVASIPDWELVHSQVQPGVPQICATQFCASQEYAAEKLCGAVLRLVKTSSRFLDRRLRVGAPHFGTRDLRASHLLSGVQRTQRTVVRVRHHSDGIGSLR